MAKRLQGSKEFVYRVMQFDGGLNSKDANTVLQDNESSDLLNVVFETRGVFKKRPGLKIDRSFDTDGTKKIVQIYQYVKRTTGEKETILVFDDGKIRSFDGVKMVELLLFEPDGTLIDYGNLQPGTVPTFFTFQDTCYFVSLEGCYKYEGRDKTKPDQYYMPLVYCPQIPYTTMAVVKNNRVFYAGDPENKDYLYFSQLGNPESIDMTVNDALYGGSTVTGGGGIIRTVSDDVEITGLSIFNDAVVILKPESIHSLTGTDPNSDFKLQQLNVKTGCISPRSVQKGNNVLYWLGSNGVFFLSSPTQNVVEAKPLSDKITGELQGKNLSNAQSFFYDSKYHLILNDVMYVLDEGLGAWTKFDFAPLCASYDHGNMRAIFSLNGHVCYFDEEQLKDEVNVDVYEPIKAYYSTPYFNLRIPEVTKRFRWIKLFFRPNDIKGSKINIKIEVDYKDTYKEANAEYMGLTWGEFDWGESYWGDARDEVSEKVPFGTVGETIRFTFSNDGLDEQLEVHQFTLGYKTKTKIK